MSSCSLTMLELSASAIDWSPTLTLKNALAFSLQLMLNPCQINKCMQCPDKREVYWWNDCQQNACRRNDLDEIWRNDCRQYDCRWDIFRLNDCTWYDLVRNVSWWNVCEQNDCRQDICRWNDCNQNACTWNDSVWMKWRILDVCRWYDCRQTGIRRNVIRQKGM